MGLATGVAALLVAVDSEVYGMPGNTTVGPPGVEPAMIVVADVGNHLIHVFRPDGTLAFQLGDYGSSKIISPRDVAVLPDGRIVVVDAGSYNLGDRRIQVFHPNGTLDFGPRGFGDVEWSGPTYNVAVAPDGRMVAVLGSSGGGYVAVFHPNGTLDFRFGEHGAGAGQLTRPTTVAVAPDGRIVVADEGHATRINVFHPNGTFDFDFGSRGSGQGQFYRMTDIAVAPDGRIVVGDRTNKRIQVFHPDGVFILSIKSYGMYGLAVAPDGRIVVAKDSDRYGSIQVFHPNGTPAFEFGRPVLREGEFIHPSSIAVGPNGSIAVLGPAEWPYNSGYARRINVFHPNGTAAHTIGPATHTNGGLGDIAVAPDGRIVAPGENHRILVLNADGSLARAFGSFGDGSEEFYGPANVAVAPDGRIVVVDTGNHRIQVFHPNGTLALSLGPFGDGSERFFRPHGLAVAPDGRIVVADRDADTGNHRIQVFHPNGTLDAAFEPYIGTSEPLYISNSVAVAPDGHIIAVEPSGDRILVFNANGSLARAFGSLGIGNEQFRSIIDVAVAPDGRIVVADHGDHVRGGYPIGNDGLGGEWRDGAYRIQVLYPNGTFDFDLEASTQPRLTLASPRDVAVGPVPLQAVPPPPTPSRWDRSDILHPAVPVPHGLQPGMIVVADAGNHRIQVFHSNGTRALSIGSEGDGQRQFRNPSGVAVAPDGRIVVADRDNHRIQAFHPNGTFNAVAEPYAGGLGKLHYPSGVAVAPDGRIVVADRDADTGNHRIQVFHPNGSLASAFGSLGIGNEQFGSVTDVAVAPDGRIVVADRDNHRIQVFHPNGSLASAFGSLGMDDGQFYAPSGVAVAPDGRIVVADSHMGRIQVFHPNGTRALSIGSEVIPLRGPADEVRLHNPTGVAVAPDGRIVTASGSFRIEVFNDDGTPAYAFGSPGNEPGRIKWMTDIDVVPAPPPVVVEPPVAPPPPVVVEPPVAPPPPVVVEPDGGDGLHNYTSVGDAANLTINVAGLTGSILDGTASSTVTFPPSETTVITSFAEVSFPPSVTASYVPADGLLALHISSEALPPDDQVQGALAYGGSGRVVPQRIVEVGTGSGNGGDWTPRVTFDRPVRILLEGQAGGRTFYIQGAAGAITPIDTVCAAADMSRVEWQLGGTGECQIDSDDGNDKIIYTHHFTRFGTVLSESGASPPMVHTCSARLLVQDLDVRASPGEYSQPVPQILINSGSLPFAGVDLEATPWYVDWDGSTTSAAADHPSLPASISEVSEAESRDTHRGVAIGPRDGYEVANGMAVASGLEGGAAAPLWFRLNLTPYDALQGGTLTQSITYQAECVPP